MNTRNATKANDHAAEAGEPMENQPLTLNSMPYFQGMYDPMAHPRVNFFGHFKTDSQNSGVAFATPVHNEDRVIAVVFTNDATMHNKPRLSLDQINKGAVEADAKPAEDRQRIWIRGAVLNGLGNPGQFTGTNAKLSDAQREAAMNLLRQNDPRLANLIDNRKAYVDVFVGDKRGFIQSLSVPVKELVATIRDLNESNCASNKSGGEIQPHLGSHRVAEILEGAMRLLERSGAIPDQGVTGQIAVDRFRQQKAAASSAAPSPSMDDEPAY